MGNLIITVVGGLLVIIIASLIGLGKNTTKVTVLGGGKVKKTGKWIILISVTMILGGFVWVGNNSPTQGGIDFSKSGTIYGLTLAGYGFLFYFVGKVIAWFQRP